MNNSTIHSALGVVIVIALIALPTPHLTGQQFSSGGDDFLAPFCSLINENIAAKLLRQRVLRDDDGCTWYGVNKNTGPPGHPFSSETLVLGGFNGKVQAGGTVSPLNLAKAAFDGMRSDLAFQIQDERSLGGPAFSSIDSPNTLQFVCLNDHIMLNLSLDLTRAEGQRSQMRDIMRQLCTYRPGKPIPNCVRFGAEIAAAGHRHNVDIVLLAAIAAQETGGPLTDSGNNVIGDQGHGHGVFQIDDRSHSAFTSTPDAMDPGKNADYAARMVRELLTRYSGDEHKALSAYNSGGPNNCGTPTQWPGQTGTLCYADSVLKHKQRLQDKGTHIDCNAK